MKSVISKVLNNHMGIEVRQTQAKHEYFFITWQTWMCISQNVEMGSLQVKSCQICYKITVSSKRK